jgi:hypothetical protein
MIIIPFFFRGLGLLVFFITLFSSLISIPFNNQSSLWWAWSIDGIILYFLGRYLNVKRIIIDSETNERMISDLFWIRMEYWGVIIEFIAIYQLCKLYF